MKLFDLFEGNEQAYNWHSEPEQRSMDATRAARLYREREPEGSEAIDARLRAQNDQLAQYAQSGNFWLKQKDTQEHISDVFVGKAAANAAAVELLKQRPELKGNLVITAYGPDEQQGVAEGDPGYDKHSFVGKIRRGREADNKGWGQLGKLFAADKEEDAMKALRRGNRYYNMTRGSNRTPGGFPKTTIEQQIYEAPGAETLGHNQSTVASNLNSLDLGEGSGEQVGFSLDSERAYQAVMSRFGDMIDQDQDSGIMYAPARLWPKIEQVAYDADGIGAQRDDDLENSEHYSVDEGDISQLEKDIADAPVAPIANMEGDEKIGGRYDADDFDDMVMRLKKLAGSGPMQTKYDPNKRVYRNVPTAQQPPQQPKK